MTPPRLPVGFVAGSALLLLLGTSGCARVPSTRYYMLELQRDGGHNSATPPSPQSLSIGVAPFRVDPPYDQDRIVYRIGRDAAEVGFYAYHRWAVPLSRMLPMMVADALRDAAGVDRIEPAVSGRSYGARLEGDLRVLEEVDTPEGQHARVVLELTLRHADGAVIWSDSLSGESTTQGVVVGDVVNEMRALLARTLDRARVRLERALRDNAP